MGDDIDGFAFALAVMKAMLEQIKSRFSEKQGSGSIECPQCKEAGVEGWVRYTFVRQARGRAKLSYYAKCSTDGCIQFTGH